jgi:hypothetical protein
MTKHLGRDIGTCQSIRKKRRKQRSNKYRLPGNAVSKKEVAEFEVFPRKEVLEYRVKNL